MDISPLTFTFPTRMVFYDCLCRVICQHLFIIGNDTGFHFANGFSYVWYDEKNEDDMNELPKTALDMFLCDLFFVNKMGQ